MGRPTDDDRVKALRRLLVGLGRGDDANQLVADIADLHVQHNTFPGEVFMGLAADALAVVGVEREPGVVYRDLLSTHLPEVAFRGEKHRRIQYAVLTAYAVHGGLEPDLLDEVTYWIEQYWTYALYAAVAIVRASATSADIPLESILTELAAKHDIARPSRRRTRHGSAGPAEVSVQVRVLALVGGTDIGVVASLQRHDPTVALPPDCSAGRNAHGRLV